MHPVGFLPPSRSDPPFEVISEPQRQGDDREGRVSEPGARKDRRAGYIQVVGLVNTTVGVDHTATRVFVHAGRAGVVVSVGIWSETGADLDLAKASCFETGGKNRPQALEFRLFLLAPAPVHLDLRETESIPRPCQHDSVFRIRLLFGVHQQLKGVEHA